MVPVLQILLHLPATILAGAVLPWDPPSSTIYETKIRNATASFHVNFNAGPSGKQANGALVSAAIDWANNAANTLGRNNFVNALLSFDTPFPDLHISDTLILIDGNVAATYYYFQGHQSGAFNGIPPAGKPLQFSNTEIFVYDEDALLDRLITINDLGRLEAQISGATPAPQPFANFSRVGNAQTTEHYRRQIKNTAAVFDDAFNSGKASTDEAGFVGWVRPNVTITSSSASNSGASTGLEAFTSLFTRWNISHPDLLAHDKYVVGEGHWVAVESALEGTFNGTFTLANGTKVDPDGRMYRTDVAKWYRFDDDGFVVEVWEAIDDNGLVTNVQS